MFFPTRQGSLRLFRLAGIQVYLHWSWFFAAIYRINASKQFYDSVLWNVLEYVALFLIVLMHEFGHAFACRSVGGTAEQIVLWPLGGVATVDAPQRPGAMLWSIAAGPLVNVMLAPVLTGAYQLGSYLNLETTSPNAFHLLQFVCFANYAILIFNLMPIYPLDGGQILRSALWFVFGKARSLMITALIGFGGVALMTVVAIIVRDWIFWLIVAFIFLCCWRGLLQARALAKIEKLPRRKGFRCPSCREMPIIGRIWICHKCNSKFDTFQTDGACPVCAEQSALTFCPECGQATPMAEWSAAWEGRA